MEDEDERRKKMTTFSTQELMEESKKSFLWWQLARLSKNTTMDEAMTKNRAPNGSAKRGRNIAKYIYRNIYSRLVYPTRSKGHRMTQYPLGVGL
jgi:hypothetical protein